MASITDLSGSPDYLSPTYTATAGLSSTNVPEEFGISNEITGFYNRNASFDTQAGYDYGASPVNPVATSTKASDDIGAFFKDVVSAFSGIYGAKAAVDISRIRADTAVNITKTQGIAPKAGANIYDSSAMTNLVVFGAIGLGVFLLVRR